MLQSLSAQAGTTVRRIGAVAGVLALGLLSTSPASAYWDRYHRWYGPCCAPGIVIGAPPPVVYAPPPPPGYYAPPPVVYAPPPVVYAPPPGISLNIR
jgi:hypothetical protein